MAFPTHQWSQEGHNMLNLDQYHARDIKCTTIDPSLARQLIKQYHYSGSIVRNSQHSFGFFLDHHLVGAAQFGPPLSYAKVLPLVKESTKHDMKELNRFVLIPGVPFNSASKSLALCLKQLASSYQWILSYANGIHSGTGTMYRASGFTLCGIKRNDNTRHASFYQLPDGREFHVLNIARKVQTKLRTEMTQAVGDPDASVSTLLKHFNAHPVPGYIYRYIKFLNPVWESRLTVPVVPYSKIQTNTTNKVPRVNSTKPTTGRNKIIIKP